MSGAIFALIRHGDYQQMPNTPSAHQPWGLTTKGCQQAETLAGTLTELMHTHGWKPADRIVSSPLLRAYQTAQILNQYWPVDSDVEVYDDLTERSLGAGNNLSIDAIECAMNQDPRVTDWPADWKSNSFFRLPVVGAESLMEAGHRVAGRLNQLNRVISRGVCVPVVGHGASLRHAAHLLGVLAFDEIKKLSMHHAEAVCIQCAGNGTWTHLAGPWKVRGNDTSYTD